MAKRKQEQNGNTAVLERPEPKAYARPEGAYDLVLGVRRIRSGSFSGLWELTELSVAPDAGVIRTIVDASTKASLVRKAWDAIRRTI